MANGSEYVGLEPKFLQRVEGVVEKDNTKANDAVLTFPQKKKKKKKKKKKAMCGSMGIMSFAGTDMSYPVRK